jgi:ankyrin repeat protein
MKRRVMMCGGIFALLCVAIVALCFNFLIKGWRQSGLLRADTAAEAEAAIAGGADVNVKDDYSRTPLHRAAAFGLTGVVQVLLDHKADISVRESDGSTPLHLAVGGFPDPDDGLESSAYGHPKAALETARLLIQHGADVNAKISHGETPLFAAVCKQDNLAVVILLDSGASARVISADLNTPLYRAVKPAYDIEIIRRLLSAGADPNVQDKWFRETALHVAAERGDAEVVRLLLAHGANPSLRDCDGKTAADRTKDSAIRALLSGQVSP